MARASHPPQSRVKRVCTIAARSVTLGPNGTLEDLRHAVLDYSHCRDCAASCLVSHVVVRLYSKCVRDADMAAGRLFLHAVHDMRLRYRHEWERRVPRMESRALNRWRGARPEQPRGSARTTRRVEFTEITEIIQRRVRVLGKAVALITGQAGNWQRDCHRVGISRLRHCGRRDEPDVVSHTKREVEALANAFLRLSRISETGRTPADHDEVVAACRKYFGKQCRSGPGSQDILKRRTEFWTNDRYQSARPFSRSASPHRFSVKAALQRAQDYLCNEHSPPQARTAWYCISRRFVPRRPAQASANTASTSTIRGVIVTDMTAAVKRIRRPNRRGSAALGTPKDYKAVTRCRGYFDY